jgi:hypothetical protein
MLTTYNLDRSELPITPQGKNSKKKFPDRNQLIHIYQFFQFICLMQPYNESHGKNPTN